jgi:hypothetical protein
MRDYISRFGWRTTGLSRFRPLRSAVQQYAVREEADVAVPEPGLPGSATNCHSPELIKQLRTLLSRRPPPWPSFAGDPKAVSPPTAVAKFRR